MSTARSAPSAASVPRSASRALIIIGRGGLAGRGLIYLTVGMLAAMAAFGVAGGETTDEQGAARTIEKLPMGTYLLIIAAIGLVGYGLWRLTEAVLNVDGSTSRRSTGKRVMLGVDGLFHAALAVILFSVAIGARQGSSEERSEDWTATVLSQPFGQWLVVIGGIAAILGGLYLSYRALTRNYGENLRACAAGWPTEAIKKAGRYGELARAVVFTIIGVFLLRAGWQHDPEETLGVGGRCTRWRSSRSASFGSPSPPSGLSPSGCTRCWLPATAGLADDGLVRGTRGSYRSEGVADARGCSASASSASRKPGATVACCGCGQRSGCGLYGRRYSIAPVRLAPLGAV